MKSFDDKVAAITGAASGMGRELALQLARRGCHLALSDVDLKGLEETVTLVRAVAAVRVTFQGLDVAERDQVFAWAERVVADHGRVNLIFNNAGVALGASLENVSFADFEWIMGINFWGVVNGTKAFLPHLRASGEGHVINTSSVFGLIAFPLNGAYNASKFAVRGFTEALRMELELEGAPVSATSVHPGGIKTRIARNARMTDSIAAFASADVATATAEFEKSFITSAEDAAATILRAVEQNRRRCLIGRDARFIDWMQRLFPAVYQRLVMRETRRRRQAIADRLSPG